MWLQFTLLQPCNGSLRSIENFQQITACKMHRAEQCVEIVTNLSEKYYIYLPTIGDCEALFMGLRSYLQDKPKSYLMLHRIVTDIVPEQYKTHSAIPSLRERNAALVQKFYSPIGFVYGMSRRPACAIDDDIEHLNYEYEEEELNVGVSPIVSKTNGGNSVGMRPA